MSSPVRTRVTSIIQALGPTANLHTSIVSRELVPMREELFADLDTPGKIAEALHKVQRHVNETTQASRSLPFLGGSYWPNVKLTANTALTLAHGVAGGLPVAWDVYRPRPASANAAAVVGVGVVEIAQNPARGTITVDSNISATVDLFFFAQPGAR